MGSYIVKETALIFFKRATVIFLILAISSCKEKELTKKSAVSSSLFFESIESAESGIDFINEVQERSETFFESFQYVYNGSGVAAGDINNDGLVDLYFGANEQPNKLYLNKGKFHFQDITVNAGVGGTENWTNGVSMVDINGDGLLDLYVCKGGWNDTQEERQNELYINQGNVSFLEKAEEYGLADTGYSMHAVFFDLDNDNDLDVYLINRPAKFALNISDYRKGETQELDDTRDKLYINDNGVFIEEGKKRGIKSNFGHSLGVTAADLNNDGHIDIYVANDFEAKDLMYINQGDGTFIENIANTTNHISFSSMGLDIADINNDGFEDIVTMEMQSADYKRSKTSMPKMNVPRFTEMLNANMHKQYMHNTLLQNHGNGFFSDIAQYAGVAKTDWSWSVLAADLDNDGYRDMFITNGLKRDITDRDAYQRIDAHLPSMKRRYSSPQEAMTKGLHEIIDLFPEVRLTNYLFKNTGRLSYTNVSKEWGFTSKSLSNGAAIADLDNDGDLDMVINNLSEPAFVFENTQGTDQNHLRFNLKGPKGNQNGLGAKIWVYKENQVQYFQQKMTRGYLSSSEPTVHFGVGESEQIDSLKIIWPDGRGQVIKKMKSNTVHSIAYVNASRDFVKPKSEREPLFIEKSDTEIIPSFTHVENDHDEYASQVLLPHEFSKNGPFVTVGDIDGDGKNDFFVGGAAGQSARLYIQSSEGFKSRTPSLFKSDADFEDMGAEMSDIDGDGDLDLIVTSGGSEYAESSKKYHARIYFNDGSGAFANRTFLPTRSSSSCLAINDFDQDGDLDIFVGGQIVAGAYAKPPSSHLFVNEKGKFVDRTKSTAPILQRTGMVNAAKWVDLTGDDRKELVIVGEWMPIKVLSYNGNGFTDISIDLGLEHTEGWWNSIAAGDFDNDGDIDLALGNLGENYKFTANPNKPFEVYADDFDGNGTHDVFLAKNYQDRKVPIRGKDCSAQQLPSVAQRFNSFESFANADIDEVIGVNFETAIHLKSYVFSSVLLENKGDGLEIKKLPKEAQFSTVNTIESFDYNKDGILDLFIAGNRFDVEIETTPADASIGYLFRGIGNLDFELVPWAESGIFVPYNIKDSEIVMFQGKEHILVTENDGPLRVFGKL